MNDEQMQPLLEIWLRDRDEAPKDADGGLARVMGKVPEVRQRGRWWPLPSFDRKVQRATVVDTSAYQPGPIPATNGRAPTLIGRTHTMFSPVKAIIAGSLVFALGGLLLVGQPFTQQPGDQMGAPPEVAVGPETTYFTGTTECTLQGRYTRVVDGIVQNEEQYACDLATTDTRLAGTEEIDLIAYIDHGEGGPWTAEAVLATDEGSWRGTAQGVYDTARSFDYGEVVYRGEGAYAGLTAHYYLAGQDDTYSLTGWITDSE